TLSHCACLMNKLSVLAGLADEYQNTSLSHSPLQHDNLYISPELAYPQLDSHIAPQAFYDLLFVAKNAPCSQTPSTHNHPFLFPPADAPTFPPSQDYHSYLR